MYLYIKKRHNAVSWSGVLEEQACYFQNLEDCIVLKIDTKSFKGLFVSLKAFYNILKNNTIKVVYINHIICALPLLPVILRFRKVRYILALHEGEPVLGFRHALKYWTKLTYKEIVRYSFLFKIPTLFIKEYYILSNLQNKSIWFSRYKKIKRFNFLGVNTTQFNQLEVFKNEVFTVGFPSDISKPEKNFVFFQKSFDAFKTIYCPQALISYTNSVSFDEMNLYYNKLHVGVVCSVFETYSLVALEIMASNRFLILSKNTGVSNALTERLDIQELVDYGVYIINQDVNELVNTLNLIYKKQPYQPRTRELLLKLELDDESVNANLYRELKNE